jgi:hypothetical protein
MLTMFFRDRIVAACVPGVAATNPAQSQPGAFRGTVNGNCFFGVLGTGWIKAALITDKQAQAELVQGDQAN